MNGSFNQKKTNTTAIIPYKGGPQTSQARPTKSARRRARIAQAALRGIRQERKIIQRNLSNGGRGGIRNSKTNRTARRDLRQARIAIRADGKQIQRVLPRFQRKRPKLSGRSLSFNKTMSSFARNAPNIVRGGATRISNVGLTMPEKLALSVSMPAAGVLFRWPSLSENPTAIANPWERYQVPQASGLGDNQPFAVVFRNPLRASIIYDANLTLTNYLYQGYCRDPDSNVLAQIITLKNTLDDTLPLIVPYFAAGTTYQPHSPNLYSGTAPFSDNYWFWVDEKISIAGSIAATFVGDFFIDYYYDGVVQEQVASFIMTDGTPNHNFLVGAELPDSGYYSLRYTCDANIADFNILLSGNHSVYAHRPLPNFIANQNSAKAFRIQGCSLMYTNKCSDLNRGGALAGYQVPANLEWQNFVSYNQLNEDQGAESIDAREGIYGFLKPTDVTDFKFMTVDEYLFKLDKNGDILDCSYPLSTTRPSMAICADMTNDQINGYWTIAFSVEYQTEDVWREIASPNLSTQDGDEAMSVLKVIDQFHSNASHIQKILNDTIRYIGKGMDVASKYGPQLANIARMFF